MKMRLVVGVVLQCEWAVALVASGQLWRAREKWRHHAAVPMWEAGGSRLFLDDGDVDVWAELVPKGLFYGITTNPLILQRAEVPVTVGAVAKLARAALDDFGVEEFMAQAWGGSADSLERCGLDLVEQVGVGVDRLIVKVPLTVDGVEAATRLKNRRGVRICLTACYGKKQAITAAAVGADYLAPYLGRMSDQGKNGLAECIDMQDTLEGMRAETRLLVASLRDTDQLFDVLSTGADATFSAAVTRDLLALPATDAAAAEFEAVAAESTSD